MSITELEEQRSKLKDLRVEHRELDARIAELQQNPFIDHLLLRRLKKRKLLLKEMIIKMESRLIPDLNA